MANFEKAFSENIKSEGGYKLHKVSGDTGGLTYAGITKKWYPDWKGWNIIDKYEEDDYPAELTSLVREFYKINYWDKIKGDSIKSDNVAEIIYDFATNAGIQTAVKIVQLVLEVEPDGIIGNVTLSKLNSVNETNFVLLYVLARIKRYAEICRNDKSQKKFLLGWINRSLQDLEEL
jgi:lysozyme family protein